MNIKILLLIVISITFYQIKGNVINYDSIPEEHKKYVPTDVRTFYEELNDGERVILYQVIKTHNGSDEDAVNKIHEKSPSLGVKTAKFYKNFNEKINMLSNETRTFLNHIKYEASLLLPQNDDTINEKKVNEFIKYFVNEYDKLSLEGKEELKKDFPALDVIAQKHKPEDVAKIITREKQNSP